MGRDVERVVFTREDRRRFRDKHRLCLDVLAQMLEESQPHAKVAAGTAEWQVRVPAGGSTTLKYRVLVRY